MADEIKQLIDMVARLKGIVEDRFEEMDQRFDNVEAAIQELNTNQLRILNSMKLLERDVKSNQKHIERLEEKDAYL